MHDLYIHLRKQIPNSWVQVLRHTPLLKFARRFQPRNKQTYHLEGMLTGYRMVVPTNWVYDIVWGEYELNSCKVVSDYVRPGMTVIDIGGHIGYHTILMAKLVGEMGKVFCFEPMDDNRQIIRENLLLNDLMKRVLVEPLAVAEKVSLMLIHDGPTSSQGSLIKSKSISRTETIQESSVSSHIVATCNLDSYFSMLDWPTISFIKMDIEGAESLAIKGMTEILRRFHPILLIESHGEVAREGFQVLLDLGYQLKCVDKQEIIEISNVSVVPIGNEHWLAKI